MNRAVLPFLACPAPSGSDRCGGALSSEGTRGPTPRLAERDPEEILEGALHCFRCSREYPILSGIAILTPDPDDYLHRYYHSVLRDIERHGQLSAGARLWLASRYGRRPGTDDYGADFRFSQQFEAPWDVARVMNPEPAEVYGPFAEWLEAIQGQGPYDLLARWAGELTHSLRMVLDTGCGGGGLLSRVAHRFQAAFGVDLSFLAVLLARRAVLHRPEAERSYLLTTRRGESIERPLQVRQAENAEFFVGDCCALPFSSGLFDALCSSNLIDIAGIEAPLAEAERLLAPDGILLLSDPFYFRDGEAPEGEPRAAVRAVLQRHGLTVEREQDAVPWAWATYDRHWRLYFNWCAAARKADSS